MSTDPTTAEPELFTPSEMSHAWLWGCLVGVLGGTVIGFAWGVFLRSTVA
jgi:hypothetical protein